MASILTFQDAVDHTLDGFDSSSVTPQRLRKARLAVRDAYRDFPYRDTWTYYLKRSQIVTEAAITTGTATYDHTGGAEERLVTLSSSVVPTNVAAWRIVLESQHYKIDRYLSGTTFTLAEDTNPGADLSAVSYTLYRNEYEAPDDFRATGRLLRLKNSVWRPCYLSPAALLDYLSFTNTPQDWMMYYTIRHTGPTLGKLSFEFAPPPLSERTYDYLYEREPREMQAFAGKPEYTTGTVTIAGTTVTGANGAAFTSKMAGAFLRLPDSTTNTPPTGKDGGPGNDNPYYEQVRILSFTNATELELEEAPAGTYSSDTKFSIGDPLDIEPAMLRAFWKMCEWYLAQKLREKRADIDAREGEWIREYRRARAADFRHSPLDDQGSSSDWRYAEVFER